MSIMYLPKKVKELLDEGKRLEAVKAIYVDYNKKSSYDRIKSKDAMEQWILDSLNASGVPYEGSLIYSWTRTSDELDKKEKKDIVSLVKDKPIYGQMKWRQPNSGGDILCCIIQPYPDNADTARTLLREGSEYLEKNFWGRDYRYQGQIYCCLDKPWKKIRCFDYQKVIKAKINQLLEEFLDSDQNLTERSSPFRSSWNKDFMMTCFRDRGRSGWDSNALKVCAYLPDNLFEEGEMHLVDMLSPPDYLFNEVLA